MEYIAVKVRVPHIGFSHKEFRKLGSFVELRKGRRNRSPKQREIPKEDAATLGSKKKFPNRVQRISRIGQ